MFATSLIGYSKKEVTSYIKSINYSHEKAISQLEDKKNKLKEENAKLKEEIQKLENRIKDIRLKDIEFYKKFVNDYFFKEWEEYYTRKTIEIKLDYEKSIEELEKIKEKLKEQIFFIKSKKEKLINELNSIVLFLDQILKQEEKALNKMLKTDFVINNQLILQKGTSITDEIVESMKEKGLLIELLKHIAREEEVYES